MLSYRCRIQGAPFTWKKGNKEVRLDPYLFNLELMMRFKHAFIQHLPYIKSDHRPIVISEESKKRKNLRRRPFRFEAAWLTYDLFISFMRNQLSTYDKNQAWRII